MTNKQATAIFAQEKEFVKTYGEENVEVLVTYYKAMKLLVSAEPINYYKVVTRTCTPDKDYYETEMGKASLARGNSKTNMPGTSGNQKDDDGKDVQGAYIADRGGKFRFYPDLGTEDKVQYYVEQKKATREEIEQLVRDGVVNKSELENRPTKGYMSLYLDTLANIVVRTKDGSKGLVADKTVPPYVK